jgi:gluconokinase
MPHIPGLRSVYAKVGRLVYFGRMLDKIRLHTAGKLPAEYVDNLGDSKINTLDGRCCRFLGVRHADIRERTLEGGSDEEILTWTHARGTPRTDEECHVWNRFLLKLGWRDERSAVLAQRVLDAGGFPGKTIETIVDHIEYDEGRDPVADRAWENI